MIEAVILIDTAIGKANAAAAKLEELRLRHAEQIKSVDAVTGPHDLIIRVRESDHNKLSNFVLDKIQKVVGVERTTTCLIINLDKPAGTNSKFVLMREHSSAR